MGWYRAPGIWNHDMVVGWKQIVDAVHAAGGRMFAQLWHMGRLVLADNLDGEQPIGPSPIAGEGETMAPPLPGNAGGFLPMKLYVVPPKMNQARHHRGDPYGGSVANRTRLLREILESVASQVEVGRIGLRCENSRGIHRLRGEPMRSPSAAPT